MSLINDMLRDLEARRAGELSAADLQREIRPLPAAPRASPLRRALPWLLALGAVASGGLWWAGQTEVPQAPVASAPPPVAAAMPLAAPAAKPPEPSPTAVSEALRLAMNLENPPPELAPPPVVATPAPEQLPRVGERPPAAPVRAEPPAVRPKVAEATPVTAGSIEKTAVLGSPRERADAEYRRALGLFSAGQEMAAHDALLAALRQDASYVPARQALLKLLLEGRRIDEAVGVLQEGLEVQPGQVGWAMSLARLLVERNDLAGAEKVLARSPGHAAANAEYAGFHGHLLVRLGRFREASERYLLATRLAPADGRWWFGLGQSLEGDGKVPEAREAFRRALAAGNLNSELNALAEARLR